MCDCPNIKLMKKLWYLITILISSALLINVISADTGTYIDQVNIGTIYIKNYSTPAETGTAYQGILITEQYNAGRSAQNNSITYPTVGIVFGDTEQSTTFNSAENRYTTFIDTTNTRPYLYFVWVRKRGTALNMQPQVRYGRSGTQYYNGFYHGNLSQNGSIYDVYGVLVEYTNISDIENSWNISRYTRTNTNTSIQMTAYNLTYGEWSQTPQPNYGDLIINYAQDIRTTGNGSDNMDLITWNAYRDTAGNSLQGKNIEIQAIAGYFEGSSYADLKTSLFSDWQASTHPAVTMYKGDIEQSHQEYTWEEVAYNFRSLNTLGTWFWNIFADNNTWYQYGWRYQARLLDEDLEPLTEWQTLYTGNSYTPSATETFTDDVPLTPDDVETINDINEQNGTTNNWYINNTVINNNEYNQTWQQNIIENIYNILQGTPDPIEQQHATDVQNTIDNAIDQEDNYINDLGNQLQDLQLPDISENNGLIKALRWVREVHHETIEETQLGTIVLVTMIIGLITYLIGRRNG